MAYPSTTLVSTSNGSVAAFAVELPEHVEGDVIFLSVAQDGAGVLTPPGAPWVVVSEGNVGQASRLIMYAVVGASQLTAPTINSTITDGYTCIAVAIKDADTANPVDSWAYGSGTGATGIASPSLTTLSNGVLLLSFVIEDQNTNIKFPIARPHILGRSSANQVTNIIGYDVAQAAGVAQSVVGGVATISDTWQYVYLGVKNKAGGGLPPVVKIPPMYLADYGYVFPTITGLSALTATIAGSNVYDLNLSSNTVTLTPLWERLTVLGRTTVQANSPGWHGCTHSISATDFTQGSLSFIHLPHGVYESEQGWLIILADSSNNWAAYNFAKKSDLPSTLPSGQLFVLNFNTLSPFATSTTQPNLSSITSIGFAYDRIDTSLTTEGSIRVSQLVYWPDTFSFVGGSNKSPVSIFGLCSLMSVAGFSDFSTQGNRQSLLGLPVTFGDGDTQSYIDVVTGASIETRKASKYRRVEAGAIAINTSPQDTVNFGSASFAAQDEFKVEILSSSSPSANYTFDASIYINFHWKSLAGVLVGGASFFNCYLVDLSGGFAEDCEFYSSVGYAAVTTPAPEKISNCSFVQGGSGGHAIEVTQPGTFAFVGNTFAGYGLDGTTDAAIYNNSGGHVVLNVSGGGDAPTVRNGTGATTDVISGAQVTVVGLAAGSQVKVTKVSNGDVLFNGAESGGQISFSTTYIGAVRVDARKASASPFYKPWSSQTNTVSGQTVEITALQELDE